MHETNTIVSQVLSATRLSIPTGKSFSVIAKNRRTFAFESLVCLSKRLKRVQQIFEIKFNRMEDDNNDNNNRR